MAAATISVLISSRKNSKYLAKFLAGALENTEDLDNTEFLVMMNAHDTWNREIIEAFKQTGLRLKVYTEDLRLGRAGLHEYFNRLYKYSTGQWVIYFCEDHFIGYRGWDNYLRQFIYERKLEPAWPWIIVPKFDNAGSMNHMLSRGFCEDIGGRLGGHGWIDSYINDMAFYMGEKRYLKPDEALFHDFTHDKPSPMDDAHLQSLISEEGKQLPKYNSGPYKDAVRKDAQSIIDALGGRE